jgi:holin-like protein
MKYIKQILVILLISFIGELFNYILPFPISGNIYGMVIMFLLLHRGFIKIHQIEETAEFLVDIMPILFIPSAVGIITQIDELKEIWLQIIFIVIFTTSFIMVISGLVTQSIINNDKKKG